VELSARDSLNQQQLVRWYYMLGTPALWLADLMWDAPLRASFIPDARLRYVYYAACVGCGLWMWKQPSLTRRIGLTEGLVNFTMTLLAIWMPIMNVYDTFDTAVVGAGPTLDPAQPVNAGISGLFTLLSYYSKQGDPHVG
jgi:hypothetical protein